VTDGDDRIRVGLDAHVLGRRGAGNETYTLALARALAREPAVDLVLYLDQRAAVDLGGGRARVRRFAFARAQPRIGLELPLRARRDRLDVLHVQYVAPPFPGTAVVTTVHDTSFLDVPELLSARRRWRLRVTVADAVRRSHLVVVPSEFSRTRVVEHYGLDPERVAVAPPLVEALPPASDEAVAGVRRAFDLPATFVLAVGDVQPRKNLPRLIEAVRIARERGFGGGLVIAGQAGWRADEVRRSAERQRGDWIRMPGYVSPATLAALYQAATLAAHVSLYEGFGLPVLEAMAAGTPVVGSRAGAIPEIAADAALLVEPDDVAGMAEAILAAASDETLRARLVGAGRERAASFRPEAGLEQTLVAYRRATARYDA